MGLRRTEREQFEGWWEAVEGSPSPDLHGKIEWEPSRGGGTEIDLRVRRLQVRDGDEVDVVCDGTVVLRAPVRGGRVHKVLASADGHAVPVLAHRVVELRHRGVMLARTALEPD